MLSTTDVLAFRHDGRPSSSALQEPTTTEAPANGCRDLSFRPGLRVKLELAAGGERRALVRWSKGGSADFTITS